MILSTFGLTLLLSQTAQSRPLDKQVNFAVERNVAPSPKIRFHVNTKNFRQIPIQIFKLPTSELRNFSRSQNDRPTPTGRPVMSFLLDVAEKNQPRPAPQDTYYQRQFNIPNISPGYYLMQVAGVGGRSWATFNVTNLSILVKRGEKHAIAWITQAKSGKTVPNATITVFRKDAKPIVATTDAKGIANLAITPGQDTILAESGRDAAVVNSYGSSRDGTVVSHMQFDRPVYRPGQTGEFKSILRRVKGLGYEPIVSTPVTMELFDPQSTLIERHELKTTAIGTIAGSFSLPQEGALGWYSVRIVHSGEMLSIQSMQVAEYRKPEFKASSTFTQKRYLSGEKIQLKLATEYYFGAKVPGAQVQMTVRRSPMSWGGERSGYSDGNYYEHDAYGANEVVAQDVRTTGADGTVMLEVPSTVGAPDSNYEFSLTITDGSSRQITHSNSVPVYAASVRVGAYATVGYVPLGQLIPITVELRDLDGGPVGGKVNLELRNRVWSEKEKREIEEVLEKTTVVVPATGKLKATMPAKSEGYLTLVVTSYDSGGRKTVSRSGIYIADPFTSPESIKAPPTVSIRLEKQQYKMGDTLTGFVESNRPGHPILLTMEGADLMSYKVLDKPGPFTYKLDRATCPNMNFDANQWNEGNRTSGAAMVFVLDPTRRLTVELKADKAELAPGDRARYTVTTKDSNGKPVPAEVGLQVIDEAIYAIQPDNTPGLVNTFWGSRPNGVATTASAPREAAGGAYQLQKNMGKDAPMRTQFVDTAYWNAFVMTDANGVGTAEFDMPGNLTAWRAQARAINGETQVGEAQTMTRSSRPLTLRLATPRQMAVGDKLKVVATITNRNPSEETVRVKVQVGEKVHEETISVFGSGDTTIQVPIEATALGKLVVRGELFDSTKSRVDGLEIAVAVNPNGVPFSEVTSGSTESGNVKFTLPENRIPGSEQVKIRFFPGPASQIGSLEDNLLRSGRYTPIIAAEQVETAARLGLAWTDDRIREPIAMIGRTHQSAGWGWWDEGTPNPVITARVLRGLATTGKYSEWDSLRQSARQAAEFQYQNVQFAEYRAHLVEALALSGSPKAAPWSVEVDESKTPISPTAQLALAHALFLTGKPAQGMARLERMSALVSRGTSSYLPVGNGVGWTGSQLEANARLLDLLCEFNPKSDLIDGLAEWIIDHASNYIGPGDAGAVIRALRRYVEVRPSPDRIGTIRLQAGGVDIPVNRQPEGLWAEAILPAACAGSPISVAGIDPRKPVRYSIEARAYKVAMIESKAGIRTLFRWEVMNEAGAWEELNRPVKRNEPVRASAIVWGDAVTDAVRVILPIPAGFEYVDSDRITNARQEVRDGAVIFYSVLSNSLPATFRFYLRAETDGTVTVPAAMAEALRRPESRGNSDSLHVVISGGT